MRKTYRLKYWLFGKRQYKSLFRQYPYYMGEEQTANFFDQFWYGMDEFLDTGHESYIIRQYNAIIDTAMLNDDFDFANIVATIFKQFDTHTKTTFITQDLTPEAIVAALYENKTADIKFEENYYIVYLPDGDSFDFEKISSVEALLKEEKLLGYWMGGGEYPKCNIKWISFEV